MDFVRRTAFGLAALLCFLRAGTAVAEPVNGRLVVLLSEDGARALARGDLVLPVPAGGDALEPRATPLFPGSSGRLARYALLRFRADRGAGRPDLPAANAKWIPVLRRSPQVWDVEEDQVLPVASLPDDPYFQGDGGLPRQFHLFRPGGLSLQAVRAWPFVPAGREVKVAVVDTGVDWRHPDLGGLNPPGDGVLAVNRVEADGVPGVDDDANGYIDDVVGWDFVDLTGVSFPPGASPALLEDAFVPDADPSDLADHGTQVAGLIQAITNNGVGVAGGAPSARILPIRVGWRGVDGSPYVLMSLCAQGLVYAARNGVRVANCSWNSANLDNLGAALDLAVDSAGVVVVGSAGNSGISSTSIQYLSSRADCIGVAGLNPDGTKASLSNYGAWVDIAAFFKGMPTTSSSVIAVNPYGGTSFSAPQVAALAALLRAVDGAASAAAVRGAIVSTARDLADVDPLYADSLGGGLADYARAVQSFGGGWDAARAARGLLSLDGFIAFFGDSAVEVFEADSGRVAPLWGNGWPFVASPEAGSLPAALSVDGFLSAPWIVWTEHDSLRARGLDGGIPPGWPIPLPPGAGSPVTVAGEGPGLGRVLVPVDGGLFDLAVSGAGVDTVTVPGSLRGVAAARVGGALWIAGLDALGNLHLSREGGVGDAETTLALGPGALPPVLGEFDGPGLPVAVAVASDASNPAGLQHVFFADPDRGWVRDVSVTGPPFVHLSLAGFPGLGRLEVVAADGAGALHLVSADGSVRMVSAGGALAGEPLSADLDGDFHTELVALRTDGVLLAWNDALGLLPGFPREFPFGASEAPAVVDGAIRRYVAVADTAGAVWALPCGTAGTPAPWTGARGGAGRSGFLGYDRATPVSTLVATLTWHGGDKGGRLCWEGTGFEVLAGLRIREAGSSSAIWEGGPVPSGCRDLEPFGHAALLLLEGRHPRDGWIRLGEARVGPAPGLHVGFPAPNPFRTATRITWNGTGGSVRIEILDLGGRRVWSSRVEGDSGGAAWSGTDDRGRPLPPGVYFLRVSSETGVLTRRITKLP